MRLLFKGGHEFTMHISNTNINFKIPDSPYKLMFSDKRVGSKMQDLCGLTGILVAWQVGVDTNENQMKKITNRIKYIE